MERAGQSHYDDPKKSKRLDRLPSDDSALNLAESDDYEG